MECEICEEIFISNLSARYYASCPLTNGRIIFIERDSLFIENTTTHAINHVAKRNSLVVGNNPFIGIMAIRNGLEPQRCVWPSSRCDFLSNKIDFFYINLRGILEQPKMSDM